jgi:hypothetical protein
MLKNVMLRENVPKMTYFCMCLKRIYFKRDGDRSDFSASYFLLRFEDCKIWPNLYKTKILQLASVKDGAMVHRRFDEGISDFSAKCF